MKFSRLLPLLGLCLGLATPAAFAADAIFDLWVDALTTEDMRADPSSATSIQYFTGSEQDSADRRLTPISKAYRGERVDAARRALAELAKFGRASCRERVLDHV